MARNGRNRRNSGVWVTFCTVFKPCIFIGFRRFEEPQDYSLRNRREPPGKAASPTKIIHPITFWLRFFFLWLRFFLFGRSKKKEMNKTDSYATGYFAFAQHDPPASCHPEHSEGSKTFLHKDISLTLNMTPRHSMGVNHTPLAYSAYTPRTLEDSSPSIRVTCGDSAAPRKKRKKNGTEVPR